MSIFEQSGRNGDPLSGELVIDAHMHVDRFYNFLIPYPDPAMLFSRARRIGIRRLYGSSLLAIRGDAEQGNAGALMVQEKYNDLFFPYIVFKPNYPEESRATIDLAEKRQIRRFKIHDDGNGIRYDHSSYLPLYEHANHTGSVVLVHTYGEMHVRPMLKIAAEFPRMKVLLGHSGITDEPVYAEAVRSRDNVFLETCCSLAWYGLIERLVAMAGPDRVVFGTDMPFMSADQQLGRVLFSRVSDEVKRRILGFNAQALFST
jgi:uncharacterized protein